jgi:hypothetical protein
MIWIYCQYLLAYFPHMTCSLLWSFLHHVAVAPRWYFLRTDALYNQYRRMFEEEVSFNFCVYSTFDTVNQAGLFWVDWLPFCANLKRIPLVSNSLIIGRTSDPPITQMAPPETRLSITVKPFPRRKVIKLEVPCLFS